MTFGVASTDIVVNEGSETTMDLVPAIMDATQRRRIREIGRR